MRRYQTTTLFLLTIFILYVISACSGRYQKNVVSYDSPTTDNCRVVIHQMGETCIPLNPQKVVALGPLEEMIALGIKPVGASVMAVGGGVGDFPPYLKDKTDGIAKLGSGSQPSLEGILPLKPELIVGSEEYVTEPIYQQLSRVAPTAVFDRRDDDWKASLRSVAETLGKTKIAEKFLNDYNQRIEEFKHKMGNRLATTQVSTIRSFKDHLRIYMKDSHSGRILQDAGLPRPPYQDKDKHSEDISLELLPLVDGDVIFVAYDDPNDSYVNTLKDHPLWLQLDAVKREKVYQVSSWYWLGSSVIGVNRALDDLFKYLVEEGKSA